MLRFEPIKKKRAQIRILCAASATRSRSVDEEEQKKKKKKKREGRRKRVPFWGFAPGGMRAPCAPKLRFLQQASPGVR